MSALKNFDDIYVEIKQNRNVVSCTFQKLS